MLRLMALSALIGGMTAIGFWKAARLDRKKALLQALCGFANSFPVALENGRYKPWELFLGAAKGPLEHCFCAASEAMKRGVAPYLAIGEALESEACRCDAGLLSEQERQSLIDLARLCDESCRPKRMQEAERISENLRQWAQAAEMEASRRGKLYRGGGFLLGASIAILLL